MLQSLLARLKYPGLPLAIVVCVWLDGHYEEVAGRPPNGRPPTAAEIWQGRQAAAESDRRDHAAAVATIDD